MLYNRDVMSDATKYVLPSAAGRILGLSTAYVRTLVSSGRLPAIVTESGVRILRLEDVLALKAERRRHPPVPGGLVARRRRARAAA